MDVQAAKSLVHGFWRHLEGADSAFSFPEQEVIAENVAFFGPAPVGTLEGRDALLARFFGPLASAFPVVRRQPHLFLGGVFEGRTWVATYGEIIGKQRAPWFRIPAGGDPRRLRFGEFYLVEAGQIVELRCLLDILGVASQAGFDLLPRFDGLAHAPVEPARGNGLCLEPQSEAESAATLTLIERMLGGCNDLEGDDLASMGMSAFWHKDMVWHGPWGVGSCFGFQEFQDFAQGPSVSSFPDRRGGFHRARIADGVTGAFTGWPSLRGRFSGEPFRGIEPTGGHIGQNIMDFYVRRGEKLHENWVLIDLIDFAQQCGVDLLARLPSERI